MSLNTKKMGLIACTGVVMGNMMGSGIVLLPASLAAIGSISVFSWLICIIGVLSLGGVFARLAMKNPQSGGPIGYARQLSPLLGFQSGVLYYHANWIGNLAVALTGVSYLSVFFPILRHVEPAAWATIAIVWIFTFINVLGGRWISRLCTLGVVLMLVPIVITMIMGWGHFNETLYLQNWNVSSHDDVHAVLLGVVVTLWAFIGVESAIVSPDMVKNPNRTVPLATLLGTIFTGIIYVLSTQVLAGIFPAWKVSESGAPFVLAVTHILGSWSAPIAAVFIAFACFSALSSWMQLVGEAGKRAAKAGHFPDIFGETDKQGIPKKGLVLAALMMTGLMAVLTLLAGPHATVASLFEVLVTDAVLLTMLPYFYSAVNLIRYEGVTTQHGLSVFYSGAACIFCFLILMGANASALSGLFIVSLSTLVFFARKSQPVQIKG